jgi:hypothetical protein
MDDHLKKAEHLLLRADQLIGNTGNVSARDLDFAKTLALVAQTHISLEKEKHTCSAHH